MMLPGQRGTRNGLSSMVGVDFEYVHAALEFEGQEFADVAVLYNGNGTFKELRGPLKRSLKIDLNKYARARNLAGVTTFNLHYNVADAWMRNEVLAHRLHRNFSVPAPCT
jgi:hypothetical protein